MCVHLYYVASPHYSSLEKQYCYDGNQYSYIFPSLTPLYSCTFGCCFFQALHYHSHSGGRLLLWSSWCFFSAWDSYCSIEVAVQISSSEPLSKPHNSPCACLGLIIFALLHGSIEIVLTNSTYFM